MVHHQLLEVVQCMSQSDSVNGDKHQKHRNHGF